MTLSARDIVLPKIKTRLETFLTDLCTISRYANSHDGTGAPTGASELVASNVACRVIEGKSNIEDVGDQQTLTEWYRLIVPVGTDLGPDYIITLADGTVYQVIDLITQRTDAMDIQALIKREVHE
jgi:hypothetical protein